MFGWNRGKALIYRMSYEGLWPLKQILFKSFRIIRAIVPILIRIDKHIFQFRMLLVDFTGFFAAHSHEGGSISIGGHTVGGDNGCAEDGLSGGRTCSRVDGMGVFLSVFDVKVAVVAGSGKAVASA